MPDKLSQSLDQILSERRKNTRRPRGGRRSAAGAKPTTTPPVGGVKKVTKSDKKPEKAAVPTGPSGSSAESKILVSNLPMDVTETQIKDYFTQTIGPVKKVLLSYGPNGKSRGVATIIFPKPGSAAQAAKDLDGLKVDSRPMRIEVLIGAKEAPAPPAPKSLGERVAQPKPATKDKPKPAGATKAAPGNKVGKKTKRGRNAGRGKPKTAEELDAEMADYFDSNASGAGAGDAAMTNGGAVQPATGGDTGMDDDVIA